MHLDDYRALVRDLRHVRESVWGDLLVFWVGDRAVGGKMFAVLNLNPKPRPGQSSPPVLSFSAGPDRYHDLLERDGVRPAPYLARAHWLALDHGAVFPREELEFLLHRAYILTYSKLSQKTRNLLDQA